MAKVTRFALKHWRLVVAPWGGLTVVGAGSVPKAVNPLTPSVATPGTVGFAANQDITTRLGLDGNEQPIIAVLTLPPGQSMKTPEGRAMAAQTFMEVRQAGHVAVVDYDNTNDPHLISADGRTTWALIDM